jgi:hypothetical protein
MAMDSLINLGGMSGMSGTIWFVFQIVIAFGVIGFMFWKFILHPRSFKDLIEIWDVTDAGLVRWVDKGKWVVDQANGTGVYKLLKHKKAKLMQPPMECAVPTKKGKMKYLFVRTGESGYDYACINQNDWMKDKAPVPLPLSDIDFVKLNLKQALLKKSLSGWFSENKAQIIFITVAVLTLVLLNWVIAFASDSVQAITASAGQQAEALSEIAQSLHDVAGKLNPGGSSGQQGITPPPGF